MMRRINAQTLKPYARSLFTAACALVMLLAVIAFPTWVELDLSSFTPPTTTSGTESEAPGAGGFALPEGFSLPEGFTPPAGMELPEGMDLADLREAFQSGQMPEGFTLPEGFTPPAGMQLPEGFTMPEGFNPSTGTNTTVPAQGGFPAGGAPGGMGQFLVPLAAVLALGLTGLGVWKPQRMWLITAGVVFCGVLALVYYVLFFALDVLIPLPISMADGATFGFWLGLVGALGLIVQAFIPRFVHDGSRETIKKMIGTTKRSGLSLSQNLTVATDALMANKMRSALTMLGIVIGVASVVSMVSVGRGATSAVTDQITATGLNLLTISPGSSTGQPGPGGGGGGGGSTDTLTYQDVEALANQLTDVDAVIGQYSTNLDVRSDGDRLQTTVLGASWQYAEVRNIEVEIGRYVSEAEYRSGSRVAVLGQQTAEELFGGVNPIGRDIRIDGKRFEVIGVLEQQDGGFGSDPNLQIHIPLTTGYRQLFDARQSRSGDDLVTSITVSVADLDAIPTVMDDIERILRDEHRLEADEDSDFSVLDQQSLLDIASSITGILTVLLGAIASVSLLVGGIGIMNIMLVSVTERTKEIGLRKAIGARRGHISQQFLIETLFLSILGGVLGVLLGVGIAMLVNASGLLTAVITADSIVLGLGFSAVIGVFFGVYPANRAAALQPIEALRYE